MRIELNKENSKFIERMWDTSGDINKEVENVDDLVNCVIYDYRKFLPIIGKIADFIYPFGLNVSQCGFENNTEEEIIKILGYELEGEE